MIDKICIFLTNKIRKEMPEIDDERAEVINYGLQNIIGEIPKIFIMLATAYVLGIFWLSVFTFITLIPYKSASGGVHLKSHIGCIIFTNLFYCLIPFVSQYLMLSQILKYIIVALIWIFGIIMIKIYAPADTENVPILSKKDRKRNKILSYVTFSIALIASLVIKDNTLSNIIIISYFVQTLTITKIAYILAKNKYGYEVYGNTSEETV